jgi:hypothetical protein
MAVTPDKHSPLGGICLPKAVNKTFAILRVLEVSAEIFGEPLIVRANLPNACDGGSNLTLVPNKCLDGRKV